MDIELIESADMLDVSPKATTGLAVQAAREVAAAPVQGPMAGALAFLANGGNAEQLERMLAIQERWEAGEARKAYTSAVAAFKLSPPKVFKDKENAQYKSRYNSIGNTVNTVNAALSEHGLSANWTVDQGEKIRVTCTLTHERGHSESCSMMGAPDASGAKNPLQQIKSTVTYLKLATYEAITGIASEEGNADDDGNGAGAHQIDPELLQAARDAAMGGWKAFAEWIKGRTNAEKDSLAPESNALKAAAKAADRKVA